MLRRLSKLKQAAQPDKTQVDEVLEIHQGALLHWDQNRFLCRVHSFSDATISLTAPLGEKGIPFFLEPGTSVECILQQNESFYGFTTEVIKSTLEEKQPVVVVLRTTEVQKTDRRAYYRVPVSLPVRYRCSDAEDFLEGRIADLSGGGALLLVEPGIPAAVGEELEVEFSLPGRDGQVRLSAVVRMADSEISNMWRKVACEFLQIPERTREQIISFVAGRQLELIRTGRLKQ